MESADTANAESELTREVRLLIERSNALQAESVRIRLEGRWVSEWLLACLKVCAKAILSFDFIVSICSELA